MSFVLTELVNGNLNASSSLPANHLHADANAVVSARRAADKGLLRIWISCYAQLLTIFKY